MDSDIHDSNDDKTQKATANDEFIRLFLSHQSKIFGFIVALVPNYSDAEDLFQETASIMWKRFDTFTPGTHFASWAIQIARYRIMKFRTRQKQQGQQLDNETMEKVMASTTLLLDKLEDRTAALQSCIEKLNVHDRTLIKLRYEQGTTTRKIAEQTRRSVHTLYKSIARIHHLLQNCVDRTLLAWEMT